MAGVRQVGVEVIGVSELRRKLERAKDDVPKTMERALSEGGELVRAAAVRNIRDKGIIDTGNLLNSVQVYEPYYEARGVDVDTGGGGRRLVVEVGTSVEYGIYHEYGTFRMDARPWLRPAFESSKDRVRLAVNLALKRRLDGIGRRRGNASSGGFGGAE